MRSLVHRAALGVVVGVCALVGGLLMSATALAAAPEAPITASPATEVQNSTAKLEGVINPLVKATVKWYFAYNEGGICTGGSTTAAEGPAEVLSQPVSTEVAGLRPGTTYTFCLVAENEATERAVGNPVAFTTTATPPEKPLTIEPAAEIRSTTAKLTGTVNPLVGDVDSWYFEYNEGNACTGGPTTPVEGPMKVLDQPVLGMAERLRAGTKYTFCLVVQNEVGATTGNAVSFTTAAPVPTIAEESIVNVTSSAATLQAQINPQGAETTYLFEYGTTASYESRIPASPTSLGAAVGAAEGVEVRLSGLQPDTTYHFRVVAANATGPAYGSDETFTTQQAGTVFTLPDGRMWELVSPPNKAGGDVETVQIGYGGLIQAAEDGNAVTYITSNPVGVGKSSPIESQALSVRGPDGWTTENLTTAHEEASAKEEGGLLNFGELDEYQIFSPDFSEAWVHPEGYTPLSPVPVKRTGHYEHETYVRDNDTGTFTPTELTRQQWYEEQLALAHGAKFTLESSIGASGSGPGEFSSPGSIAVQRPSGDFFVADGKNDRIEVFDPKGKYLTEITGAEVPGGTLGEASGIAVDDSVHLENGPNSVSAGDVYVAARSQGVVDKFQPKGPEPMEGYEYVCQIGVASGGCIKAATPEPSQPTSVAVDGYGNVYVGRSDGAVEEFDSGGNFLATLGAATLSTAGIAVNASGGAVYVVTDAGALTKLTVSPGSHEVESEIALLGEGVTTVAVDQETGNLFVDEGSSGVREYEQTATEKAGEPPLAEFAGGGEIGHGSIGIAYSRDSGTGMVYAAETGGKVLIYAFTTSKSCNPSTAPAKGEEVDAVSQDGCYVYFNSAGGSGPLELAHDAGSKWTTTAVPSLEGVIKWRLTGEHDGPAEELSPNGRYLTFMSNATPTGYDNRDAVSGARDEEVYIYDAVAGKLSCASCDPSGARPVGVFDPGTNWEGRLLVDRNDEWEGSTLAGSLPDWIAYGQSKLIYQPHYLSDTGRLFFNSPDTLVPAAVSGQENVYEYEPAGAGSCLGLTPCLSLISSGASGQESAFADASINGDDVFFLTAARLVSQDYDNSYDMYDAHLCTASVPCVPPAPVSPPPCETGDSCKASPTPQPGIFGPPPSATFVGAGNAVSLPATAAPVAKPRKLTRKQKLAVALRTCAKKRRAKRRSCESEARRHYGVKSPKTATVKRLSKTAKHNSVGG